MIIDNLSNAGRYHALHPLFETAFDYLRSLNYETLLPVTVEIADSRINAGIVNAKLKSKQDARLEIHHKYIDIHIPVSKEEIFGWKSTSGLEKPIDKFDTEKDIQFYNDEPSAYVSARPGEFVIFFPEDAHAPLVGHGEIQKIIMKIAVK